MEHTDIMLYRPTNTNYEQNGDWTLNSIITDDEISGGLFEQWAFTFTIPVDNPMGVALEPDMVVKTPTPDFDEPQLFYISIIERSMTHWHATALHVCNRLKHIYLPASLIREKPLTEAFKQLTVNNGTGYRFTLYTDRPDRIIDTNIVRMNALRAIADESTEESLVSQGGLEFTANNYEIHLLNRIGKDRGVDLRIGRDLIRFAESIDTSDVVGRVVPVGTDGFTIPADEGGPYVSLVDIKEIKEEFKQGEHLTRAVEYNHITARTGANEDDENALPVHEAIRQLKRLGRREFTLNQVHHPIVSYDVDYVMAVTDAHRELLQQLQVIRLGDTITIVDDQENEIKERLTSYTYKPTRREYTQLTLANKLPQLTAEEKARRI